MTATSSRLGQSTLVTTTAAITMIAATIFAALLFVGRWYFQLGGELVQLAMVTGTVVTSCLLVVTRILESTRFESLARYGRPALFLTAVLTIVAWSPGFAFTLILASGICLAFWATQIANVFGLTVQSADQPHANGDSIPSIERIADRCDESALNFDHSSSLPENSSSPVYERSQSGESAVNVSKPETGERLDSAEMVVEEDEPWQLLRENILKNPSVSHLLTRWRGDDGAESVVAIIRCRFLPNEQHETIHIPIWPFFQSIPDVYCEVVEGPAATVKTTERKQHGLRLDVRIDKKSAETTELVVEVIASTESVQCQSQLQISDSDAA